MAGRHGVVNHFTLRTAKVQRGRLSAELVNCDAGSGRRPERQTAGAAVLPYALEPPRTPDPSSRHTAALRANSDTVESRTIRDSGGSIVHPVISCPAADMAVVIEADPTGQCAGANAPITLSICSQGPLTAAAWQQGWTGPRLKLPRFREVLADNPAGGSYPQAKYVGSRPARTKSMICSRIQTIMERVAWQSRVLRPRLEKRHQTTSTLASNTR